MRALPQHGPGPKLSRRQEEILEFARVHAEAPLQELLRATGAASQTVRRLEDKGLLAIAPKISERDPYARETILPTQSLTMNAEQARALAEISAALQGQGPPQRRLSAARGDGQREDGSLFAGDCAGAGAGEGSDCAGAGDFAHAANGGTLQGAVQFRAAANAGGRACTAICPPANAMTNGTKSARAAPASPSARARPCSRRWSGWG